MAQDCEKQTQKADPRCIRSRIQLRQALADEIRDKGDLSRVTVTSLTERAGLTRRTFYLHYRDIPDFVCHIEDECLADIRELGKTISQTTLEELYDIIKSFGPCPGAVELLTYFKDNASYLVPLLGSGGDPAFIERIKDMVHDVMAPRALHDFDIAALGDFFDYYLTFAISAETGVLLRWLRSGMHESVEVMARVMTLLMFVRPGDLYNNPSDLNIPQYGLALMQMEAQSHE